LGCPQERREFGQFPLIFDFSNKAPDRVDLPGTGALAHPIHLSEITARQADKRGSLAESVRKSRCSLA